MPESIRQHAAERLAFVHGAPASDRLTACKVFLKEEMAALRERHEAGAPGLQIAGERSQIMDALLSRLFAYAHASYEPDEGEDPITVALVALGGYGRGELSPWSDLDLMFLFPAKTKLPAVKRFQEYLTQEVLYPLWDCGLKVGHSIRTLDQVFDDARENIQTKTALLAGTL